MKVIFFWLVFFGYEVGIRGGVFIVLAKWKKIV